MKPFDVVAAGAGAPVCTRDGRDVRILATDCRSAGDYYPVVALVTVTTGEEIVRVFTKEGKLNATSIDHSTDLIMKIPKVTKWLNIYHTLGTVGTYHNGGNLYNTEEEARSAGEQCTNYLATVPVEFEV